jgi:hypothetical protein
MVRSGYAALSTYPPDVKYVEQIREAQTFAREHGYGLWSGCVTDAQGDTHELTAAQATVVAPPPAAGAPEPAAEPAPASGECDLVSYPDVCIPPIGIAGDLDCGQITPPALYRPAA